MATAVLDLEFERLPPAITGLDRYDRALILIRLHGQPVGKTLLPVINGYIGGAGLRNALVSSIDWVFWERWLHNYLNWDEMLWRDSSLPKATIAVCTRDRTEDL